jgi:conjugative transfer region protein TrbK
MDSKMLFRLGAIAFVAFAIVATAIQVNRTADTPVADAPPLSIYKPVADPLRTELARCQGLGEAGAHDTACLKAWAENRRRFIGIGSPLDSVLRRLDERAAPESGSALSRLGEPTAPKSEPRTTLPEPGELPAPEAH